MTTTSAPPAGQTGDTTTTRAWLGVLSLALGAAIIVTTEFITVGFLPDVAADLDVSLGVAGAMVLVPGLSAAVAAPLVIVGARRLDRRALILGLGSLVVVSNALAAVAPNFGVVMLARVFLGVAIGGFWAVVPSLGARLAGLASGARATSIIVAGLSAGTVIGLPAGQFLGTLIGWRWTFAVTAAATVLIVLAQLTLLPKIPAIGTMTFAGLADVFRVRGGRPILLAAAVINIGQFAASTFVTPFLLRDGHLGAGTTSALFLGYGIAGIGGTLLGGPLVNRGRVLTFAGASAAIGVVLVLLPVVAGIPLAIGVLYVAWGLIWGLVPLALQTLMLTATPSAPEAGSAVLITVMQLALGAGSALGGVLVDSAGLAALFFVSGAIAITAALVGLNARRAPASIGQSPGSRTVGSP